MKQFFKKPESVLINCGRVQTIIALCLLLSVFAGCAASQPEPLKRVDTAMGTVISQTIYVTRQGERVWSPRWETNANEAGKNQDETAPTEAVMSLISDLEQNMLSWRIPTSEIYHVNDKAAAGQDGIPLSQELSNIINTCLAVSDASDGAFDIAMGKVIRLWNIDEWSRTGNTGYQLPSKDELSIALSKSGRRLVSLQENTLYLSNQAQLDLGAVGKGIALQEILNYLQEQESQNKVEGAVISVGGSILTFGKKPDGGSWLVGILDPVDTSKNLGYLELTGQWCVSTSGDYERFVEVDGVRYHHIIDPATGYPAGSDVSSVTILTKDGLLSDALSTACFVLGVEEGGRLAQKYDAEALFVDKSGQLHMTQGMEEYFRLSK